MLTNFYIPLIPTNKFFRWVYKRIFVADGNFKADHVRQKNEVDDVWLSEGSGMIPKRQEYFSFLATAIERLTVSIFHLQMSSGMFLFGNLYSAPWQKHFCRLIG